MEKREISLHASLSQRIYAKRKPCFVIGNPSLLIVDEPTAGLDPAERRRFQNILAKVGEEPVVILSTHIVDDVKELCSQVAIMGRGRILKMGDHAAMTAK